MKNLTTKDEDAIRRVESMGYNVTTYSWEVILSLVSLGIGIIIGALLW